jgi:hypothetical protein
VIANPLYSVSSMNVPAPEPQEYWPQPADVKDELRQFLPRGYDSVIVVWYKGDANSTDPDDKVPFGSFGAALVSPEQFEGKQFTWSTVSVERSDFSQSNPGAGFAANVQDPGEALLHEWLHSIGGWGFYGQNGYQLPDADESDFYDAASDADYADTSPGVGGFEAFYRDLLRGRIVAQLPGSPIPEQFGLSPGVWEYGTLRAHGFPAPAQLRSPIDGACVTPTPTLRWVSPNVLGSEIYEVLIYAEGDLVNPILIGTTNDIQFQVGGGLVDGETYFWRVRPLSQSGTPPTGDLLRFHVASQVEAPILVPDGGGLHPEGGLVSVGLASSSAEIHYTTTGTDPTRADTAVQPGEEFLVVPPAFVKARAWRTGCNPSPVTTRFFSAFSQARIFTYTDESGDGSLRKAILDAIASPGSELIRFDIPGAGVHTIAPASNLPDITDPVVIDATTQPGWSSLPLIELRGQALVTRGFRILAGSSTISGFAINGFASHGIQIEQAGGNSIYACFIGTNAAGSAALANQGSGIHIDGSQFNFIGGTTAALRNLISGNRIRGIEIRNPGSRLNYVRGNYIGTTARARARSQRLRRHPDRRCVRERHRRHDGRRAQSDQRKRLLRQQRRRRGDRERPRHEERRRRQLHRYERGGHRRPWELALRGDHFSDRRRHELRLEQPDRRSGTGCAQRDLRERRARRRDPGRSDRRHRELRTGELHRHRFLRQLRSG